MEKINQNCSTNPQSSPNILCEKEEKNNLNNDGKNQEEESKSSSSHSCFEEEIEETQAAPTDIERNYELMKHRSEQMKFQFRYEYNGVVIYDSTAKMITETTKTDKKCQIESPIAYPLRKSFRVDFFKRTSNNIQTREK
eukprot:TRINITY_DN7045_c0_g1_i1.p1 TRINITY_DN7045_c0_g1~~TRINITY_DN7045_c0_g1_i1.p1  ORF type:complete len:139 (+),score=24.64 TRINITY_DN7045_c0_g1_i1:2-418(+)